MRVFRVQTKAVKSLSALALMNVTINGSPTNEVMGHSVSCGQVQAESFDPGAYYAVNYNQGGYISFVSRDIIV